MVLATALTGAPQRWDKAGVQTELAPGPGMHEPLSKTSFWWQHVRRTRSGGVHVETLRRWRPIGACLAVLAVGLLAGGCDWAQFAGGYSHTGDSTGEVFISPTNVSTLSSKFTTVPVGKDSADYIGDEAAIANGVMYVSASDGNLYAYDASGSTNCSGTPTACAPLWTSSLGDTSGGLSDTTPVVANGVVYVLSSSEVSPYTLYAFDAAGKTNCSGTPTVCSPLWTASVNTAYAGNLTVHNGLLYAVTNGSMEVFDASGVVDCSGTPKTCSPMWTTTPGMSLDTGVTISSSNIAYAAGGPTGSTIYAFDASGSTNCSSGVCSPLWTYTTEDPASLPVVSGSTLYVDTYQLDITGGSPGMPTATLVGGLEAFDANGSTNCSGTPSVCAPLWQSTQSSTNLYAAQDPPAVANGDVYVPTSAGPIAAFDANGSKNCSGTPVVCSPLWTTSVNGGWNPLTVGGSVLYAVAGGHDVYAFDATGVNGCANGLCSPLWSNTSLIPQGVSIANDGTLYVSSVNATQVGDEVIDHGFVDAFGVP